jgi:Bacterial transcriptional activator domain
LLEEADALYAGDYLPDDLYESWAAERRDRLKQLWAGPQLALGSQREQAGNVDGALTALRRTVQADLCDEPAAAALIELLARHGHRAEALRMHDRLAQALRDHLGDEPSEPVASIRRRIQAAQSSPTGDPDRASLGQEMVRAAEQLGQPGPLFWAHSALALAFMGRGQIERTLELGVVVAGWILHIPLPISAIPDATTRASLAGRVRRRDRPGTAA